MTRTTPGGVPTNEGYAYRDVVGPDGAGCLVSEYLAARHPHSTCEEWAARASRGEVAVNGVVSVADTPLAAGASVVWSRPPWVEAEVPLAFAVLYRDEALLAVAKPSGLPTAPAGGFLAHTLLALVQARFPEADPMHRLGRGTSGLVLFACTPHARSQVAAAWRTGAVRKVYRALVTGHPEAAFTVRTPIGPVPHDVLGTVNAASPNGRAACSHARMLERRNDGTSLLDVEIETGRPHQIRIHMAAAGCPLQGDPLYGPGGLPRAGASALPGEGGYALHAHALELAHPTTGVALHLWCAPPFALRTEKERGAPPLAG